VLLCGQKNVKEKRTDWKKNKIPDFNSPTWVHFPVSQANQLKASCPEPAYWQDVPAISTKNITKSKSNHRSQSSTEISAAIWQTQLILLLFVCTKNFRIQTCIKNLSLGTQYELQKSAQTRFWILVDKNRFLDFYSITVDPVSMWVMGMQADTQIESAWPIGHLSGHVGEHSPYHVFAFVAREKLNVLISHQNTTVLYKPATLYHVKLELYKQKSKGQFV